MTKSKLQWLMLRHDAVYPLPTLAELLQSVRGGTDDLTWHMAGVSCVGENSETLHRWSDDAVAVSGRQLFEASRKIQQVIEGRFNAKPTTDPRRVVEIRAVDGGLWLVGSDDRAIMAALEAKYPGAQSVNPE